MEERKLREVFERHASDDRAIAVEILVPAQPREFGSLCSVFSLKAWLKYGIENGRLS
jgi:hypothetical protein